MKEEEYFQSVCHICRGEPLPFPITTTFGLLQHITECHLPLKCDKCTQVFENATDLKNVIACNHMANVSKLESVQEEEVKISSESDGTHLTPSNISKQPKCIDEVETRKPKTLERQTSTPMLNELKTTFSDPSASAIQISSINSTAGGSSLDSDYSPLERRKNGKSTITISPKRSSKRQKMAVEATPLRQVMSKSIQRAMLEHGHYRSSTYMTQRKMSFNSSNNSSDQSLSLQKFQLSSASTSAPLDLRLSPAIRRQSDDVPAILPMTNLTQTIEYQQIEVYIRRSEIKSDTTASSNYRSVLSETGRSDSMPDMQHETPKFIGHNNFLKKVISFENPSYIESTPMISPNSDYDDEVFYTPNASPVQTSRIKRYEKKESIVDIVEDETSKPKIWNFMRKLSENITDSLSNEKLWNFPFKKPVFMKRAAEYFSSSNDDDDEIPSKRRRTSSNDLKSPAQKRQKIHGRKPISRMREFS